VKAGHSISITLSFSSEIYRDTSRRVHDFDHFPAERLCAVPLPYPDDPDHLSDVDAKWMPGRIVFEEFPLFVFLNFFIKFEEQQ
jgi:hypothetical protein